MHCCIVHILFNSAGTKFNGMCKEPKQNTSGLWSLRVRCIAYRSLSRQVTKKKEKSEAEFSMPHGGKQEQR